MADNTERSDWLLLLLAFKGAPDGLDPVRIQKGMFLFSEEAGVPERQRYRFTAYNYGPMSASIYGDVDELVLLGLAERVDVPGQRWKRVRATKKGIAKARKVMRSAGEENADAVQSLYATKQLIAGQTFGELLKYVYDRYPEYAVNSVFRSA